MKKKIIFPLFFLLLFIAITNVFAQRILEIEGGNVQGYWQDTVIVHGNITLLGNDTLIIEQGTLILFDQDVHFLVFGKLEAVGSDNMPIIFRNNNLEQWNGIHFRGIVPEFEYCHFIHTKDDPAYALKGAVSFKAGIEGIPPIRHCFFKKNSGGSLYFKTVINYNENIEIIQNVFDVTEKFAVQLKSCAFDSLKLINNQMASSNPDITTKGIIVEHDCVCTFILLENNQLTGFNVLPEDGGGAAVQIDSIPYASMLFKHNQFLNNHGIKAGGINIQGANLVVFTGENRFENNTGISGAAAITCNEITVENNIFIDNHNPDGANGGGAMTLVLDAGGSGYFQNNTFDNNDASGFFVDGGCITVTNIGSGFIHNLFFIENTFVNSDIQGNGGAIAINCFQLTHLSIKENSFGNLEAGLNGGCIMLNSVEKVAFIEIVNNSADTCKANGKGGFSYFSFLNNDSIAISQNDFTFCRTPFADGGVNYMNANSIGEFSFDNNNFLNCNTKGGNGGVVCMEAAQTGNMKFLHNKAEDTLFSKNSGGFLYINCENEMESIQISQNEFTTCIAGEGSGGCIYLSSGSIGSFYVSNNKITDLATSTQGIGGFLFLESSGQISSIHFTENEIAKSHAGMNGGIASILLSNILTSFTFDGNIIGETSADSSGGTLYLNCPAVDNFTFTNNLINTQTIAADKGGCLCLAIDNTIGEINFAFNNLNKCQADNGSGGALFVSTQSCNNFSAISNTINGQTNANGGSGGFVFLNCSSTSGDILFDNNLTGGAFAHNNGGYVFIQSPQTGNISFTNETVNQSTIAQNGTGGFVSINTDPLSFVQVSSTHVSQNSQSGSQGGFVYLNTSGILDSLILTDNSINSCSADGEGGTLYTEAEAIQFINIQSNNIASSSVTELNGGFVYLHLNNDIDSLQLSGNNINTTTSIDGKGGGLYCKARDIRKIIITDNIISSSAFAQQDGGFVFFDARTIIDFMLGSNQISNVTECGGSGGLAHITLSNLIEFFRCNDNTLSEASAGASGGAIYLVSPKIIYVEFTNNQITSQTYAADDGGCLYISSLSSLGSLDLTENNLNTCEAGNGSGGTLYLEATSGNIISIASNKITGSTNANEGSGGFLYIGLTEDLPEINVVDNIINRSSASQNGGYLFLSGQNFEVVNIENEVIGQTSEAVAGDGGFTCIECDTLGELTCSNISINKSWSGGSGGVAHIHPGITVGSLFFENININESEAVGSGGVIYVDSETDIHSFQFRNSTIQSSVAGNDGGCIYVNSHTKTESVIIINNIFHDFTSLYGNGGCLFIQNGLKPNSSVFVNNSSFIRQSEFGSYSIKGGGIYVKTCDSLFVSDSEFNSLISQQGGGALYAQDINVVLLPNDLTFKSNFSGYAPDNTITFNNAQGGAIYATEVGSLLIDDAQFVNNKSSLSGGAIYVQDIDTLDIQNSKFTRNIGFNIDSVNNESKGGGLFFDNLIQASISLNYFTGNSSFRGGALFGYDSKLLICDNVFSKNEAWYGAGLYLENCSDEAKRNYIFNNKANFSGGGIYLKRSDNNPGYLLVDSNMVINNYAEEGGGIYSNNSADRFSRNHIGLNQCTLSTSNENQGGGVFLSKKGAGSDFYNCLIYSNQIIRSEKPGSGIFIDPDGSNPDNQTDIINCTIFNNSHYGIFQDTLNETDISECHIQNSLIWGNNAKRISDQVNFNENIESFYSNVYGAVEGPPYHNLNGLNPIFVGSTNLNLRADTVFYSPCIDHGDPLPEYFDQYFPPSYGSDTNDIGATGGPMAVNDSLFYVLQSAQYLLDSISIEIQASNCLVYSFTVWPDNPNLEYTWITNNQVSSGGLNLSYEYPDYGNYTVCVYAESVIGGSLLTDMICKIIEISPPPIINQLNDCPTVVFNDTLWVNYNDIPVDSTITICANVTGSFDEPHWSVNPEGSGTITSFSDSTCQVLLSPIEFYQEQITITYFIENDCGSDEKSFVFVVDTIAKGPDYINEQGFQNFDVNIYPNPAREAFYLELNGPEVGQYFLLLLSTGNQLVFESQINKTSHNHRIKVDVGLLPKGIYTGKVFNNKGITVFKIVIH